MEPSEDPSLSTPLVGIWAPRLSGRTRPRCFGGPFVFTSTNLSPQASSLNVEEFQDLWPCVSLVTEQGPTGDKQSPEGDEAQLWSTCLCLESLASFVLMRPGEYWAILQQYGCSPHMDPACETLERQAQGLVLELLCPTAGGWQGLFAAAAGAAVLLV